MANRTTRKSASKLDAVSIALGWLERGILTVPLEPGTKRPSGGNGWNNLRITRENVRDHFRDGDNIGALWGEPSGWVVDVDLDMDEAARAAGRLLTKTFTYGRETRPQTHYLYKSEGCRTTKWVAPDGSVIVEIRSTKTQSVLPPSVHPTGERYSIDRDVAIATMPSDSLRERLAKLAAVSLLAESYPERGSRHDFIHAFVGALLRDEHKPEAARVLGLALLDAVGVKEDDLEQRRRTIENTITHHVAGDNTYGWNSMRTWVDAAVLKRVRTWLTLRSSEEVPITVDSSNPTTYAAPHRLLEPPGLVGEIAAWSKGKSFILQPVFDLAVGIQSVAMLTANRYLVDVWDTPLQPYSMLLAPTSGGKESALSSTYEILRRSRLGETTFQGFQSYHALLDRLAAAGSACWLWDEAARKLKSAVRSHGGQDFQVLTWLLSLYGKAATSAPGVPGRHNAIPAVERPFLTIMAAAQPAQLIDAITGGDLGTGVINRFVLYDAGDGLAAENLRRESIFPSRLELAIRRLRALAPPTGERPFETIKFATNEVYQVFRDFSSYTRERARGADTGEIWGRANQSALILAGVVAAGCGRADGRTQITLEVARWAIDFSLWSFERWAARLERGVASNFIEAKSMRVESVIRDAPRYAKRFARDPKKSKMLARGLMPRSILTLLTRSMTRREMDEHLDSLVEGDLIATNEDDGVTVYWAKR